MKAEATSLELCGNGQGGAVWLWLAGIWVLHLAMLVWFIAQLGRAALIHPISAVLCAGLLLLAGLS